MHGLGAVARLTASRHPMGPERALDRAGSDAKLQANLFRQVPFPEFFWKYSQWTDFHGENVSCSLQAPVPGIAWQRLGTKLVCVERVRGWRLSFNRVKAGMRLKLILLRYFAYLSFCAGNQHLEEGGARSRNSLQYCPNWNTSESQRGTNWMGFWSNRCDLDCLGKPGNPCDHLSSVLTEWINLVSLAPFKEKWRFCGFCLLRT